MSHRVETKSGEKIQTFSTGAIRGDEDNKPQFIENGFQWAGYNLDTGKIYFAYNGTPAEADVNNPPINYALPWSETDTSMIPDLMLNRVGGLFWRGAQKYSRDNWKKGMSMARTFSSMFRHMIYWWAGDTSEDHLSAVIWNATVLMWTEAQVVNHVLPDNLADCGPMKGYKRDTGKV